MRLSRRWQWQALGLAAALALAPLPARASTSSTSSTTATSGTSEAAATSAAANAVPDRLLVGFRTGLPPDPAAFAAALGARHLGTIAPLRVLVLGVPADRAGTAAAAAAARTEVAYAELDKVARATETDQPNDALYGQQWGAKAIKLPAAWELTGTLGPTRDGHNRTIAIIDTGIDRTHADLLANYCHAGAGFVSGTGIGVPGATEDDHGHGTHVAGIAAAAIDNLQGVAGTSEACLMAVKVLNAAGIGFYSDVAAGIAYAADEGAHVLSLSLGGESPDTTLKNAVDYARGKGALVVAAAGNDGCPSKGKNAGKSTVGYPGRYADLAVAALEAAEAVAGYSSCGPEVDIAAPGSNIWSTFAGNTYLALSGTSMATPFVSGVAALSWSCTTGLSASQLKGNLMTTADGIGSTADRVGAGRLDAEGAAGAARCSPSPA